MGVIEKCCREGCKSKFCTRYNPKVGFICEECFDDFINYLVSVDYNIRFCEEPMWRFLQAFVKHPKDFQFGSRYTPIKVAEAAAKVAFPLLGV